MSIPSSCRIVSISLFLILSLGKCDQCTDCELSIPERKVSFTFINADSLQKVEGSLVILSGQQAVADSVFESIEEQLATATDSLTRLQTGIDTGNVDLIPARDELLMVMGMDSVQLDSVVLIRNELVADIQVLNATRTDILEGNILVKEITNLVDDLSVSFEDSTDLYPVALNVNDTISRLNFRIGEEDYAINLSHNNFLATDPRRNVFVDISSFMIVDHSFDSVAPNNCFTDKCPVDGTMLVCYF